MKSAATRFQAMMSDALCSVFVVCRPSQRCLSAVLLQRADAATLTSRAGQRLSLSPQQRGLQGSLNRLLSTRIDENFA